jgi:signal transduction histidine kinase
MEDARLRALVEELRAENAALAALCTFLQEHSEREKAALARELHDSLGGILTPAKMDLAWLRGRLQGDSEYEERMRRLEALVDQGIELKRRVIEDLRPSLLDHLGIGAALQWHAEEACRKAGIDCRMALDANVGRLTPAMEIALFRLVQESIANAVKHANAKALDLTLRQTAEGLELVVVDDGVGIEDLERAEALSRGLAGMRNRMRALGGTFNITTGAGRGTRIVATCPAIPR